MPFFVSVIGTSEFGERGEDGDWCLLTVVR